MSLFSKIAKPARSIAVVDPADGYIMGWHVNRFVGHETQMRIWLSQLKFFATKNAPRVESFFSVLHLNREDHDWVFDRIESGRFWGGQYLFNRGSKKISLIFGQYPDIKSRFDRFWPKVGLSDEVLQELTDGARQQGMLVIGVATRFIDSKDHLSLAEVPHTLVGVAVCEPIFSQTRIDKLSAQMGKIKIVTAYDRGIIRDFARPLGYSVQNIVEAPALPESPELWVKAVDQADAISHASELDRFHIINYLGQRFQVVIPPVQD